MSYKYPIKIGIAEKWPKNDRNNRKDTKNPLIGMGQKGQRLGNSGASRAIISHLLVIC